MTQTQFGCAMIIGADSPQGRELAQALAAAGAEVLALQGEAAAGVDALQADIASVEGLARALDTLRQRGPVDLLVNCAQGPAGDGPRFLRRHGESAAVLARAAVSLMPDTGGAVVNVIPVESLLGEGGDALSAAGGALLARFTAALQAEVGGRDIRVRTLCLPAQGVASMLDALSEAVSGDLLLSVPDAGDRRRVQQSLERQARLLGQ